MHTFAVYVEDQPGRAEPRVVAVQAARIQHPLARASARPKTPGVSRMTVVVRTDDGGAARIRAHLDKLVPVIRVEDLSERPAVVRDLALIKVSASHESRAAVMQLADVFGGKRRGRRAGVAGRRDLRARRPRWTACSKCCARTACWRWCAPDAWRWIAAIGRPRRRARRGRPRSKRPTACRSRCTDREPE